MNKLFKNVGLCLAFALAVCAAVAAVMGHPTDSLMAGLNSHLDLKADALSGLVFGGMIINRATLMAFFTGLQTQYNNAFSKVETTYEQYSMPVPSSTAQEQYGWMGMIPGLREWIGDRQLANIRTYDFTIKNKPWERTLTVSRTHIEDDVVGIYSPMATGLALEAKRHPQELLDNLVVNGFTNLCYDGQPFFSANHPTYNEDGSVTLVSNTAGGAAAPWFLIDDTRGVMPFIVQTRKKPKFVSMQDETDERVFMANEFRYGVDWRGNVGYGLWQLAYASKQTLTDANYEAARAAMKSMTGDNQRKLGLTPKILLVGATNEVAALKLVQAETLANGATNVNRGTTRVVVSPYL
ncbi:MAG: Mu-like prophage major head subunit gpT family protein [Rhodoferax sp.]|nr:Mu-like prophage major head subunit gpT family protein [Rhodoferax sp.]